MRSERGYSLLEMSVALVAIALFLAICIPLFGQQFQSTKALVCKENRTNLSHQIEYETVDGSMTEQEAFNELSPDYQCPSGGTLYYINGEVKCTTHGE